MKSNQNIFQTKINISKKQVKKKRRRNKKKDERKMLFPNNHKKQMKIKKENYPKVINHRDNKIRIQNSKTKSNKLLLIQMMNKMTDRIYLNNYRLEILTKV